MCHRWLLPVVSCVSLSGCCGNYQLIGLMDKWRPLQDDLQWRQERELRAPRDRVEELVVRVAANHLALVDGSMMVVYISHNQKDTLICAVEDISDTKDGFAPKRVTRYLVQSGRIHAVQGPLLEPFPDVAFERSVVYIAGRAVSEGGMSVVTVGNWLKPLALKGVVSGKCKVEVSVFAAEPNGPGPMLCRKSVNVCGPE